MKPNGRTLSIVVKGRTLVVLGGTGEIIAAGRPREAAATLRAFFEDLIGQDDEPEDEGGGL